MCLGILENPPEYLSLANFLQNYLSGLLRHFKNPIMYLLETSPVAFTASDLCLGSGSNIVS